jgi:hypothetical protein
MNYQRKQPSAGGGAADPDDAEEASRPTEARGKSRRKGNADTVIAHWGRQ